MIDRTQEINLKLDNGLLNYDDAQYLLTKTKEAKCILERIAIVSKNANDSQHSTRQALDIIKNLTANFIGE